MRRPLEEYRLLRMQMDRLARISEADTPGDAFEQLEWLCRDLGFDYTMTGVIFNKDGAQTLSLDHCSDGTRHSVVDYIDKGLDAIDPLAEALAKGLKGATSTAFAKKLNRTRQDDMNRVLEHLHQDGFEKHGVLALDLPGQTGIGYLGLGNREGGATDDMERRFERSLPILRLGGLAFASSLIAQSGEGRPNPLTKAEQQVLNRLADGLTPREIAEEEGKALSTVRQQIGSARNRLGARTVPQAVARAQALHLIRRP